MDYHTIEQSLRGKTAFITGGTSGIGKACVEIFCGAGVNVAMIGRNVEAGQEIETAINALNQGVCKFYPCDVRDLNRLEEVIDLTAKDFGGIDILVNCAGYFPSQKPIDQLTLEAYEDVMNTNLRSYVMGCKYTLPYIRRNKGAIINIGSIVALTAGVGCVGYSCAKGAIEAFTRALAVEEARNGVRVNEVKPGHINSVIYKKLVEEKGAKSKYCQFMDNVQILGRGGEPEEIAYTALFLASDWSSFITGAQILATGGYELGEAEKQPYQFISWPEPIIK